MPTAFSAGTEVKELIESLSQENIDHANHVCKYVQLFSGMVFGADKYQRQTLANVPADWGACAFYHDIGKILIPQAILLKAGALTDEEFAVIRDHTIFAKEIINMVRNEHLTGIPKRLIPDTFDAAVYHHEWWNGKGYPYGLAGEEIPLIARVTSICDAYDAMTSWRIYRDARPHRYACEELRRGAGAQFEADLVDIFLYYESEFEKLIPIYE